jgi:hypothetical protein
MNPQDYAMLWQIASGFRFDLLGGYVLTPFQSPNRAGAGPGGGFAPQTLDPATVPQILFELAFGGLPAGPDPIGLEPWSVEELRTFILRYHVDEVVVGPLGVAPGYATHFLTAALREQPVSSGGVKVWYDVQRSPLVLRGG